MGTAVSMLEKNIEKYRNWLNSSQSDEKYAHITDEERSTCYAKCDEISGWLYEMLDKQSGLAQNVNPVLTVAAVNGKSSELSNVCSPIVHKPVPKKKEEKKEEKAPDPPSTTTA